jgi:hypothetical protein
VRDVVGAEAGFDDRPLNAKDATEVVGEVVGEAVAAERAGDHVHHPFAERPPEHRAGGVEPVVDGRHGDAEERRDVALRVLAQVEQREHLALRLWEPPDRVEHEPPLLGGADGFVRARAARGEVERVVERRELQVAAAPHPTARVADDPAEPAGEGPRVTERVEPRVRRDERVLRRVLREMKVPQQRHRRREREVLVPADDLRERPDVAAAGFGDQFVESRGCGDGSRRFHAPSNVRCRERAGRFTENRLDKEVDQVLPPRPVLRERG